jgi:hypothetical protein
MMYYRHQPERLKKTDMAVMLFYVRQKYYISECCTLLQGIRITVNCLRSHT